MQDWNKSLYLAKNMELRSGPFNCNPDQILPPKYQIPSNYEFGSMGVFDFR
ncbi:MAG: hypothetical protein IPK61_07240 [Saprospiraceae bacterium]|nr:hypothetical protein [Saprospiraceae bacterium]